MANRLQIAWKLCTQLVPYLRIFIVIILLCSNPFFCQSIANCMAECSEIIPARSNISVLDEGEMQVPIEALFYAGDIFHQRDFSKGYRLLLFQIALRTLCHSLRGLEALLSAAKSKQKLYAKRKRTQTQKMSAVCIKRSMSYRGVTLPAEPRSLFRRKKKSARFGVQKHPEKKRQGASKEVSYG